MKEIKTYTLYQILSALRLWEGIWNINMNPVTWHNFKMDLEETRTRSIKRLPQVRALKRKKKK